MMRRKLSVGLLLLMLCPHALGTATSSPPDNQKQKRKPGHLYQVSEPDAKTGKKRVGFIDRTGRLVIGFDKLPETTDGVGEFHDGRARIYLEMERADKAKGSWRHIAGYIDETGAMVIAPRFKFAYDFSEGLARVALEGVAGFIDLEGKVVIKIDAWVGDFHEGLAAASMPGGREPLGYIDRLGTMVIKPQYQFADDFSEGLAGVQVDDKWGFINRQGELVIAPRFGLRREQRHPENVISSGRFSEGLACVRLGDLYGYIDKRGKFVIPPQFSSAQDFSEGLAWAISKDSTKRGWINKAGQWVITKVSGNGFSVDFSQETLTEGWMDHSFSEGLFPIVVDDGDSNKARRGYINTRGTVVIEPRELRDAEPFVGDLAHVTFNDKSRPGWDPPYAYINKKGNYIWRTK